MKDGGKQKMNVAREDLFPNLTLRYVQCSFPVGTHGNGVPILILAVETPFPHLVIRSFGSDATK